MRATPIPYILNLVSIVLVMEVFRWSYLKKREIEAEILKDSEQFAKDSNLRFNVVRESPSLDVISPFLFAQMLIFVVSFYY